MKVKIKDIIVEDRIRKEMGDVEGLAASMQKHGQLQPIIIDDELKLIAGGRRLAAATLNGWDDVEAIRRDDLDPISKKEVELEENICRKDMTWVEEIFALLGLYDLRVLKYGKDFYWENSPGTKKAYGIVDVADDTGKSIGGVSMDLQLARAVQRYPDLANEGSKVAAFKRFKRMEETALRAEIAKREMAKKDPFEAIGAVAVGDDETISEADRKQQEYADSTRQQEPLQAGTEGTVRQPIRKATWKGRGMLYWADSRDVLKLLPPKSIDCIVTDPPFALGMHKEGDSTSNTRLAQNVGHMYDDDPAKIMDMLDIVFMHCARLLKPNGHAYVFFHMTKYEEMYLMLRKHFGTCEETPIIWIKNTPGIGDPNRSWTYAYEPCFFINTGRDLVKPQAFNYLRYDTVPPGQKIHPTQKADALLRHIVSASTVQGEVILDPFAGGGSTLVAASQLGCRFVGVEREEPFFRATADRIAQEIATVEELAEVKDVETSAEANG